MQTAKRLNSQDLSPAQIASLEALYTPAWPDVWRDLARSFFITLLSEPPLAGQSPAELAIQLTLGFAKDFGGSQTYIPTGALWRSQERMNEVLELRRQGKDYSFIAKTFGLTVSRVRHIEAESRSHRKKVAS